MKTLKLMCAVIVIVFFTNSNLIGQVWQTDVVVNFNEYDYTPYAPFLGIVTGSYTYHYSIKLSNEGKIENVHWVVKDCNLQNQNGDKILVIDTGHDNLGLLWEFWNRPNAGNGNIAELVYNIQDGWLDDYMPSAMLPYVEGALVNMSYKMMIKGQKWDFYAAMVQLHMNANGVITAEVVKP